jgi:hypothetical protein
MVRRPPRRSSARYMNRRAARCAREVRVAGIFKGAHYAGFPALPRAVRSGMTVTLGGDSKRPERSESPEYPGSDVRVTRYTAP